MGQVPAVVGTQACAPVPFIDLVAQHRTIAAEVADAVSRVLAEQKFILGDEVAEFEFEVAEYCDAREAIACASGTDALSLSLAVLGIGPGDEVITTPFTFFATAGAIHRSGARPVFVDIDRETFNLDPAHVAAAITPRTKAILPVHLFGHCADMEPLWRLAVRHNLAIIEDACQAIGAEYRGRRAGVLGTLACFSFFPTKNLGGAGDGGMITTDDVELARRLRRLRVHGDVGGYTHVEVGMNSRLDALQAAILRVKLRRLEAWTEARRANAARYGELFAGHGLLDASDPDAASVRVTHEARGAVELPVERPECRHVFNQFSIRVKDGRRDEVLASLREQQIGAAIYYPLPLHVQECFRGLGCREGDFPVAEAAAREVLALPVFPELSVPQQERVVDGIAQALRTSGAAVAPHFFEREERRVA